jgi:hypothetical protein
LALETIARHGLKHPSRFLHPPAKRNHDTQIGKTHILTDTAQRGTFKRKSGGVGRVRIARSATKTQHWVLFLWLEPFTTNKFRIFVCLEIRKSDDHGLGIECGGDHTNALRQLFDKVVGRASVIANQPLNGLPRALGRYFLRTNQSHRMEPNMIADYEFHPRQTNTVIRQHRAAECEFRIPEIQHDCSARSLDIGHFNSDGFECKFAGIDATDFSFGTGHGHN